MVMKTIKEIKNLIARNTKDNDPYNLKPDLTLNELKELRDAIDDGRKQCLLDKNQKTDQIDEWRELISNRIYGC